MTIASSPSVAPPVGQRHLPASAIPAHAPGACPVCGARSIAPEGASSALLAVCDVLIIKTLETIGKGIIRQERDRFRRFGTRPWHIAHTVWRPDRVVVNRQLEHAWDVVPALLDTHGCCGVTSVQVSEMLDSYVRSLIELAQAHDVRLLASAFQEQMGLPVYLNTTYEAAGDRRG